VLDEFEVLIPISVVKPNAGQSGLNMLAFGNVGASKQDRHIGHFIVSIILMSYTLFLIWREYNHFIEIRQAWLSSPQHVSLARTRTIAISNIPTDVNSGSGIKELAGTVGRLTGTSASRPSNVTDSVAPEGDFDGVRSVWLTRKIKDLEKTWEERDKECARLEGGVSQLQKLGNQNERKGKTPEKQGKCARRRLLPGQC